MCMCCVYHSPGEQSSISSFLQFILLIGGGDSETDCSWNGEPQEPTDNWRPCCSVWVKEGKI